AVNLFFQDCKVRKCGALVFLDDDVASAKQAQAFAEGKMHVKRNRCAAGVCGRMDLCEIGGGGSVGPDRGRRGGGVGGGGAGGGGGGGGVGGSKYFLGAVRVGRGLVEGGGGGRGVAPNSSFKRGAESGAGPGKKKKTERRCPPQNFRDAGSSTPSRYSSRR